MTIGFATNDKQKQKLKTFLGPSPSFVSRLSDLPDDADVLVCSLMDFGVGVIRLHELSEKFTIATLDGAPADPVKFFADIERNARRQRSKQAADRKRAAGERLGPKTLIERLPKKRVAAIRDAVMDPDRSIHAICKDFKIDRRALINGFEDELRGMGKLK